MGSQRSANPFLVRAWPGIGACWFAANSLSLGAESDPAAHYSDTVRPLLERHCITCHAAEDPEGDLDLERFAKLQNVVTAPRVWENVIEQLELDEMPPRRKPRLTADEKATLLDFAKGTLDSIAQANAGDPGPVVLRRLSNAEYTYTLRDLTGISALDPAAEFPADSAAGEGFTNTGAALVMSPAFLVKYLDAAKSVAEHLVPLPDGITFSPHTMPNDWAEERLDAIRGIYDRYTSTGGETSLNLQGVRVNSQDAGVIPLERYVSAILGHPIPSGDGPPLLSQSYLKLLTEALQTDDGSLPLADIRDRWRKAESADIPSLVAEIERWQAALWQFNSIGHIGKRDGPRAWQEPTSPLVESHSIHLKLPGTSELPAPLVVSLVVSDAGDGTVGDSAILENPVLVREGKKPIPLAILPKLEAEIHDLITTALPQTSAYLDALAESHRSGKPLAGTGRLDPQLLAHWAALVRLESSGAPRPVTPFTARLGDADLRSSLRGWGSAETPSAIANSAAEAMTIGTVTFPPRAVVIHPSPSTEAIIDWRSPVDGEFHVSGKIADADGHGGNGVTWKVEMVTPEGTHGIGSGILENGKQAEFEAKRGAQIRKGDLVRVAVGPRDGNHGFDSTHVDLEIAEIGGARRVWNLANEVCDRSGEANPLADAAGHPDVWFFGTAGDTSDSTDQVPPGSALATWRNAVIAGEPANPAAVAKALTDPEASDIPANRELRDRLLDWDGPLGWLHIALDRVGADDSSIEATAPAVLEFTIPPTLAADAEILATAKLATANPEGSIQFHGVLGEIDESLAHTLTPVAPVIAVHGGAARARIEAGFERFRKLFPAALCYRRLVPVDEVVTLTLYHREDERLSKLMLDESEAATLDRLWQELHFIKQTPLLLVDAYEQLWQYATQDADPSAFEPMREPIHRAAAEFHSALAAAEPRQLSAVIEFASRAWRRPLADADKTKLEKLYQQLRQQEVSHNEAVQLTLARILTAPEFLYKIEKPGAGETAVPVNDQELATRLSYFLWSSAPDVELTELAATGKLRDPETLSAQTRRMIADERIRRLALEFGCQWLQIRDFDTLDEKSETHFPEFASVQSALHEEPIRFFTHLFQENRPLHELLDADYTYANATLAEWYELNELHHSGWQRVENITARGRGGLLGFGATLARHSGASRTSPILRGTWIVEVLLGEHLPAPPKDIPILPEEAPAGLSERELTEKHSSDPACSRCHLRIDPFGFALEHYDTVGRLRDLDVTGNPVNAHGKTADGFEITGIEGLRAYLLDQRRDDFVRQFSRKLLGYALGREIQPSDRPLLDEMVAANRDDARIGKLIEMIVLSPQFRNIRGIQHLDHP